MSEDDKSQCKFGAQQRQSVEVTQADEEVSCVGPSEDQQDLHERLCHLENET